MYQNLEVPLQDEMDYSIIYIGEKPDFKEFHVHCAVDPINFTHAVEIQKYSFFIRFQHSGYKKTLYGGRYCK